MLSYELHTVVEFFLLSQSCSDTHSPNGFVFTTCLYVFTACPVEMLPTLRLKNAILPILTGTVQVRLVIFTTGPFAFKYSWLV